MDSGASIRFEDLDVEERRVDAPAASSSHEGSLPRFPARDGIDDDLYARSVPTSPAQPGMEMDLVEKQPAVIVYPEVGAQLTGRNDGCREEQVHVYPEVGAQLTGRNDGLHPSVNDPNDIPLDKLVGLLDQAMRDEAREFDREIMQIIGSLGGNSGKYRRER